MAANVAAFVRESSFATDDARDRFVALYALVPYDLTHGVMLAAPAPPAILTLVTAQFLHGSMLHVFFNMLILLVFGPIVERAFGPLRFIAFYLCCGILGGIAQVSAIPGSHVPTIGASGAIAGVLGAYAIRFPTGTILRIPALLAIGLWVGVQFVHGFAPTSPDALSESGSAVAYFAHIGGFLAGVFLTSLFTKSQRGRQGPRLRFRH